MREFVLKCLLILGFNLMFLDSASSQENAWRTGLRLPFASSQLFDFSTPKLGLEFGEFGSNVNFAIELGMPVHANRESVRSKGYYTGLQITRSPELSRPRRFEYSYGVKAYYMKGILKDYLKYEKPYLSDTYFKYELTEFNKTRLFAGLTFILSYKLISDFYLEYQLDLGYARYKVNVPGSVVQRDYHNYYSFKPFYEGVGSNVSLNLFYKLN